eukprot:scaffold360_cov63-Phaeocystis_antarctica.AAC.1
MALLTMALLTMALLTMALLTMALLTMALLTMALLTMALLTMARLLLHHPHVARRAHTVREHHVPRQVRVRVRLRLRVRVRVRVRLRLPAKGEGEVSVRVSITRPAELLLDSALLESARSTSFLRRRVERGTPRSVLRDPLPPSRPASDIRPSPCPRRGSHVRVAEQDLPAAPGFESCAAYEARHARGRGEAVHRGGGDGLALLRAEAVEPPTWRELWRLGPAARERSPDGSSVSRCAVRVGARCGLSARPLLKQMAAVWASLGGAIINARAPRPQDSSFEIFLHAREATVALTHHVSLPHVRASVVAAQPQPQPQPQPKEAPAPGELGSASSLALALPRRALHEVVDAQERLSPMVLEPVELRVHSSVHPGRARRGSRQPAGAEWTRSRQPRRSPARPPP